MVKISMNLSNSRNMVFNVKKLSNDGVDLTLRQMKRSEQNERQKLQQPPMNDFCRRTYQWQHVPRAFETACIPLGPEDVS
jgi:hypothetical protein